MTLTLFTTFRMHPKRRGMASEISLFSVWLLRVSDGVYKRRAVAQRPAGGRWATQGAGARRGRGVRTQTVWLQVFRHALPPVLTWVLHLAPPSHFCYCWLVHIYAVFPCQGVRVYTGIGGNERRTRTYLMATHSCVISCSRWNICGLMVG